MSTERRAAIDIGTVTCRLLVADVTDGVVDEVVRRQAITHLGAGWADTGELSVEGIARMATAVGAFAEEAAMLGVSKTVAVATSAARDARNQDAFLTSLEAPGVRPHIISGEREGYLTFLGVTYSFCDERVLVVDVGGGSTELILGGSCVGADGKQVDIESVRSLDVGSRRVTELFLRSDPPTARELDEAAGWIADELRAHRPVMRAHPHEMVAVAGTATSLAAIDLGLATYDPDRVHGYRICGAALLDMLENLSAMPERERRHVIGLEPDRAGVIVGGALILQAVMAYAGLSSTLVSEHDILYGMVLDPDAAGAPE